jgi:flagellar hook assembly protein FlgD
LRNAAVALAFALVAALGVVVPSVAAASGDPKVVIIVGATHGTTSSYRADGDVAYAEARKYTSNVVKVYSPNATWAAVKAATTGASIVIYMGHGNGWPSPYTYDPAYTTKDGFGLNATAGAGDYNVKYYGEPSVATFDLAPGAIILLHHLCYASGNSEPGNAEGSVTVARQRADNYAAGFLKAGAAAVIADGHAGAESYLRALFTTHQSIDQMWHTMPNRNNHFVSFASGRTPGATISQDPITTTTGFYRSLAIGSLGVTTDEVVAGGFGDTGANPASLVVPGGAAVGTAGGSLYGSPDTTIAATAVVPAGTRLRLADVPGAVTASGVRVVAVVGLDDTSITGFMIASALLPRDSAAPIVRGLDAGGPVSPNGDGRSDTATMRGRFTETVAWTLRVRNAATDVVFQTAGTGTTFQATWDGKALGAAVPDGTYTVSVSGVDTWGNAPGVSTGSLRVDTVGPTVTSVTPAADVIQWFSPNGDGVRELVGVNPTSTEAGTLIARVLDAGGGLVKTWSVATSGALTNVAWDGKNTAGAFVADGTYKIRVASQDAAGNLGAGVDRSVSVIGALRLVATSRTIYFPNDADSLAATTRLSFTLARPMTVTWTVRNAAGATVMTHLTDSAETAGTHDWTFDGRGPTGALLPRGKYTSNVTATDGTLTANQTTTFEAEAFVITPSDTTPGRGQTITVTVISPEALARTPTLWVYQPGLARYAVRMTQYGTSTFKITIRLKSTGRTGQMSLMVWGLDTGGGTQSTTRAYTLH